MTTTRSRANLVASAAMCAALYAIINSITSFIGTPFGVGEFRPGVVVPAFFAIVSGPIPAAIGAATGSFIGDMISLVPFGKSTFVLALAAGATGNFLGFFILGWIFEKLKNWKGFIIGTTSGLFFGNLVAATVVVLMLSFPYSIIAGLLLFWFGTMFPFVIVFVPAMVRVMRPYASKLTHKGYYPEIVEPNKKVLWGWSIVVSILVIAALVVALFSQSSFVAENGGALPWEVLFVVSAISVLVIGGYLPKISGKPNKKPQETKAVQ